MNYNILSIDFRELWDIYISLLLLIMKNLHLIDCNTSLSGRESIKYFIELLEELEKLKIEENKPIEENPNIKAYKLRR